MEWFVSEINAIRIDSVALIGNDSVFFPYKEIRFDNSNCLDTSWVGERIIARNNGVTVFYSGNDSIVLEQNAAVNQSWTIYRWRDGKYIEGKVATIGLESFLGVSDSVKKIGLQAYNGSGNTINNLFNSKEIWLSKNYGLVKFYNVKNFPDDTASYDLFGNSIEKLDFKILDLKRYGISM
jgi:hypothetical protein